MFSIFSYFADFPFSIFSIFHIFRVWCSLSMFSCQWDDCILDEQTNPRSVRFHLMDRSTLVYIYIYIYTSIHFYLFISIYIYIYMYIIQICNTSSPDNNDSTKLVISIRAGGKPPAWRITNFELIISWASYVIYLYNIHWLLHIPCL